MLATARRFGDRQALPTMTRAELPPINRAGKTVWRAYYRDPSGHQRNKSFARKVDAEAYLATVESSKLLGAYIDPARAKLTMGEWSKRWLDGQVQLKRSTRERYAGILREHIDPTWQRVKLADVSHADVRRCPRPRLQILARPRKRLRPPQFGRRRCVAPTGFEPALPP